MLFSPTFVCVNLMFNAFQVLIKMALRCLHQLFEGILHMTLHVDLKALFCTGDVIARKKSTDIALLTDLYSNCT